MIPKVIHYCWFGGNPLPKDAKKCIESWKKFFPGYQIIEWNESNFDVNKIPYIKEAYAAHKYAFVSDYARFDILYQYGGIYFDTDVEVIKSFEDIVANGAFMGCEIDGVQLSNCSQSCCTNAHNHIAVNPGVGMAAPANMDFFKEILDYYADLNFISSDGSYNMVTVVTHVTNLLIEKGLKDISEIQNVAGITIYPKEYFNPRNNNTGKLQITEHTHSIHWYSMSWLSSRNRMKSKITRVFHRFFGDECFHRFKGRKS